MLEQIEIEPIMRRLRTGAREPIERPIIWMNLDLALAARSGRALRGIAVEAGVLCSLARSTARQIRFGKDELHRLVLQLAAGLPALEHRLVRLDENRVGDLRRWAAGGLRRFLPRLGRGCGEGCCQRRRCWLS